MNPIIDGFIAELVGWGVNATAWLKPPAHRGSKASLATLWGVSLLILLLWAQVSVCAASPLTRQEWQVDGVTREALVHIPPKAKTQPTPVVFAFHGHGGTMQRAAQMFRYHVLWPEAIVVYPQGLNTSGKLVDPEGKRPGWQIAAGEHGDRDLKCFDTILASLRHDYNVDAKRLYATGHSQGGVFTYLLWSARGESFAAFAPSAAVAPGLVAGHALAPKPVLHVAGKNDQLVKYAWQQATINALRRNNQCEEGQALGPGQVMHLYPSRIGAPVVTFIHPGKHEFPAQAPGAIVKFFQKHTRLPLASTGQSAGGAPR